MAFTIKELASLSGIKAHTIRIWEQRYHFLKPSRTPTNIRTYSNEELKTLLTVALLNKYGYKISRIDDMPEEQRNKEVWNIREKEGQNEHIVNQLIGFMIDLNTFEFEQVLNKHIQQHGMQETILSIIFFFLNKVGILWQTNHINPAHEHVVSNIIRQKIIAAIELLPVIPQSPSFLLFLPEDEFHELGLLYVYYLVKQKGYSVLYIGANVPFQDICYVAAVKQPRFLYTHITASSRDFNLQKYLSSLSTAIPESQLLFSGNAVQSYKKEVPQNVVLLRSFEDVMDYITSL